MSINKNYLWILLFGSLIGLNETLIGGLKIPFHSIVLNTITLFLLAVARYYYPKAGTSLVIIAIAFLFKINNMGIQTCTVPALLCGPAALLMLGIGFEVFASLLVGQKPFRNINYILSCAVTSLVVFSVFGVLQTYILGSWDTARLMNYIFVRGPITAITASAISMVGLFLARHVKIANSARLNPNVVHGLLFSVILALWLFGYYSA